MKKELKFNEHEDVYSKIHIRMDGQVTFFK